jgi:hypothetical protein
LNITIWNYRLRGRVNYVKRLGNGLTEGEEEINDSASLVSSISDGFRDEVYKVEQNNHISTKNKKNKDTTDQKPGVKPPFHPINSDTKWTECYDSKPYDLDYPLYPPGTNSPLDWANLGDLKNNSDCHSEDNSENQTDMSFSAFVVPTGEMSTRGKAKKLRDFASYSPFQFMNDNNEIGASGASCSSTYNSNSNYDTNIKNKRNIPNCHSVLKNEDGNTHLKSEKREKFSILDINSDSHGRLPFPQNKKIKTEKKVSYV